MPRPKRAQLDHAIRLQADTDLYIHLALRKFEGREWDQFVRLLTGYAYQVITAWTATGAITRQALDYRVRGVPATQRSLRRDDLDELVTDIVHTDICVFRRPGARHRPLTPCDALRRRSPLGLERQRCHWIGHSERRGDQGAHHRSRHRHGVSLHDGGHRPGGGCQRLLHVLTLPQ